MSTIPGKTLIGRCSCPHQFQDEQHGRGLRVFNVMKVDTPQLMRCTVCGNTKPIPQREHA
jgi:hypothetical protein